MTRLNAANSILTTLSIDIQNVVQVPVITNVSVQIGHLIYGDSSGRFFSQCLDKDCQNPECLLKAVHDS